MLTEQEIKLLLEVLDWDTRAEIEFFETQKQTYTWIWEHNISRHDLMTVSQMRSKYKHERTSA